MTEEELELMERAAVASLRTWSKPPFGREATMLSYEVTALIRHIDRQDERISLLEGQLEAAERLMEFNHD